MNQRRIAVLALSAVAVASPVAAQDMPEMPKPQKEHQWLQRLVGEWETEAEFDTESGQPPMKAKGTESVRSLGGFFVVGDVNGDFMGQPYSAVITLGYDPAKQKYVGTWVDSVMGYLWHYTGEVDESANTLTLESKGPCPKRPGLANFREVIEIKDADNRKFTSSMQEDDGTWSKIMTVTYRRKK